MSILNRLAGMIRTSEGRTLHRYSASHYLEDGPRAKTTLKWLRNAIDAFERYLGRPATLDDLTVENLIAFASHRQREASRSTTTRDVERLMTIWRHAHTRGFIRLGPLQSKPQIMAHTQARAEV